MPDIAIIGAGPAGLMAAEKLASAGCNVTIYDRKPSIGRKFLMAGRGGLNLTHSENIEPFLQRYGTAQPRLETAIRQFLPQDLRDWCEGLGEKTFIGSSGRVFPVSFKASPLLRAWQKRLDSLGVKFALSHEFKGWDKEDQLLFETPDGKKTVKATAALLALGGASWPKLGSDGKWVALLKECGVAVAPLVPSNCGFCVTWSDIFKTKFAGQPLKPLTVSIADRVIQGEAMITDKGIEGGVIYALSPLIRNSIAKDGTAVIHLDLKPALGTEALLEKLSRPRQAKSFSQFLRVSVDLSPLAIGLLQENRAAQTMPPQQLLDLIKSYPLTLNATFPIDRAISSAGGISFDAVDDDFMIKAMPGVFAAGEMLDWEAPTGGYLLQASFSTAVRAAEGILKYIKA